MPRDSRTGFWPRLLWTAFVLNLIAAVFLSPITQLRTIKVQGAAPAYKPYISSILRKSKAIPALRVEPLAVESQVLASSAVESCDFRRNIFGRAVLRVQYRSPVAVLEADPEIFLDESGCVYRSLERRDGLPVLDVFDGALKPILAITGTWPSKRIADLALASKKYDFGPSTTVEVQSSGAVSLRTNSGATIRFGAPYDFGEKFAKLDELLNREPELFRKAKSVNLTAPDRATWIPE